MSNTKITDYRLDKTYAEILSAVEAGQIVQVQYQNESDQINLYILQQICKTLQGAYTVTVWNYQDDEYVFGASSADGVLETAG